MLPPHSPRGSPLTRILGAAVGVALASVPTASVGRGQDAANGDEQDGRDDRPDRGPAGVGQVPVG